jgi:hypothetical protein
MYPKRTTMYVIFTSSSQHGRVGTRYIANDGTKTEIISQAAKFYSFACAQKFAKQMNIELTALTYIGQDDLEDYDLARFPG